MKNLANKSLIYSLLLCFVLTSLIMPTVGCGASELVQDINTAQAVVSSAANILSSVNPQTGALMSTAASDLGLMSSLIQQYDSAVAAGKPGIATQIQSVTATVTANLTNILAAVKVSNPELVEYITVAVAVANSVVGVVLAHLPSAGVTTQAAVISQSQALPTVKFSSHKDLKNAWNAAVKGKFAHATI